MKRERRPISLVIGILAATFASTVASLALTAAPAVADAFTNPGVITIPDASCAGTPGVATPYPSNITVGGLSGTVSNVTVTLNNVNSDFQGDLELLLVSPAGGAHNLVLLSDAGTGTLTNAAVTLDDAAAAQAPQNSGWPPGSYKPTNYSELPPNNVDAFPAPAPSPSASSTLAMAFDGIVPNGTWSLYVVDDACGDAADTISGGWTLNITTAVGAATTTTVTSSPNPSATGQSATFTATVSSGGSPVTTGTVTFTEGATTLAANVPVNGSGKATLTKADFAEGNHVVTATYNGVAAFNTSNGSVNHRVDNVTTVTGTQYCNTGPITINAEPTTTATPYPSNIFVSSAPTSIVKVTATLKNVSHPYPDDIDVLLVGPAGQNLVLVSDAGNPGASPPGASNVTAVFDDAAAGQLPQDAPWGSPGSTVSSKPVDYDPGAQVDTWPPPAPAPSAATTLSTFDGTNPNGTWSLDVVSDGAPDTGSIAGGWCLNFTFATQPTVSVNNVSQNEGSGGGSTDFAFTITLSAASASPVTVQYYTANVEAVAPGDYTAILPTVITFAPGETSKVVHVAVAADNTAEPNERFVVKLTHPVGASLGNATGTGTIVNDDGPLPTVSINDVAMPEGSGGGTTPFTFTVTLATASTQVVTVPWATVDLEATAPSDYEAATGSLSFAPGDTSKTLTVNVVADMTPEPNERFQVRLSPPINATRAKGVGIGTIVNDD